MITGGTALTAAGVSTAAASTDAGQDSLEGLDFVASWIEQIASKVKVSIRDVTVRVLSTSANSGSSSSGDTLLLRLDRYSL
jgi:hypothetical protein